MATSQVNSSSSGHAIAHRILIVDDDPETARFIKNLLKKHGFDGIVAKDGGQAHSSFVMRKPDFVLLDVILPGESGFEVCERMKQTDETIPVLFVTAIDLEDARNLATRVGADGYITKPIDTKELLSQITEISHRVWERYHLDQPKEEHRIRFSCRCGKRFKVSPVHKGRTLTCPDCGEPLIVPRHD